MTKLRPDWHLSQYSIGTASMAISLGLTSLSPLLEKTPYKSTAVLSALAMSLTLAFIDRFPKLSMSIFLLEFALVSFTPSLHITATPFIAMVFLGAVAASQEAISTTVALFTVYVIGVVDVNHEFEEFDWTTALIWLFLLALATGTGRLFQRVRRARVDYELRNAEFASKYASHVGRTLHNSVAATITDIVMQAEARSMQSSIASEERYLMKEFGNLGREALVDIQNLVDVLQNPVQSFHSTTQNTQSIILDFIDRLEKFGFKVENNNPNSSFQLSPQGRSVLRECLSEIGTNAIKFGDKESPVQVSLHSTPSKLRIAIRNRIASPEQHSNLNPPSSGRGLDTIRELLDLVNASFRAHSDLDFWVAEMQFNAHTIATEEL